MKTTRPRAAVDGVERGHRPVAGGQRADQRAVGGVEVEVAPAGALRAPYEAAVVEPGEVVAEVHPGRPGLAEERRAGAVVRVAQQQVEDRLVAVQPLDGDALAVRPPVDAGEVGGRVVAGVEPSGVATTHRHDADAHVRVVGAGLGVLLLADRGVGHLREVDQRIGLHRLLVELVVGEARAVRAPPVAGGVAAPDLLPVHPVGGAVEDVVLLAAGGQGERFGAGAERQHPQVVVADEGHPVAVRRHRRLAVLLRLVMGEPARLAAGRRHLPQLALAGQQQALAIRRPRDSVPTPSPLRPSSAAASEPSFGAAVSRRASTLCGSPPGVTTHSAVPSPSSHR